MQEAAQPRCDLLQEGLVTGEELPRGELVDVESSDGPEELAQVGGCQAADVSDQGQGRRHVGGRERAGLG